MIVANIEDYRKQCEARLPPFLYDYISGGSFQENTLRANISELQATLLRQRVMVDESHLNLSIQLWDETVSLPIVLGPVGMAGMYSSRGEVKAAKAAGVPFTLSTMGVCDVREVAQESGIPPWFQLYMLKDRGFVKSVIERSVSAGSCNPRTAVQRGARRDGEGPDASGDAGIRCPRCDAPPLGSRYHHQRLAAEIRYGS
jgi:L-lactate dehydrogenase (cytochrome)